MDTVTETWRKERYLEPDLKGFSFEEYLVLCICKNGSKMGSSYFSDTSDKEEGLGFFPL